MMNGRIWCNSKVGVGSTFSFTVCLPATNTTSLSVLAPLLQAQKQQSSGGLHSPTITSFSSFNYLQPHLVSTVASKHLLIIKAEGYSRSLLSQFFGSLSLIVTFHSYHTIKHMPDQALKLYLQSFHAIIIDYESCYEVITAEQMQSADVSDIIESNIRTDLIRTNSNELRSDNSGRQYSRSVPTTQRRVSDSSQSGSGPSSLERATTAHSVPSSELALSPPYASSTSLNNNGAIGDAPLLPDLPELLESNVTKLLQRIQALSIQTQIILALYRIQRYHHLKHLIQATLFKPMFPHKMFSTVLQCLSPNASVVLPSSPALAMSSLFNGSRAGLITPTSSGSSSASASPYASPHASPTGAVVDADSFLLKEEHSSRIAAIQSTLMRADKALHGNMNGNQEDSHLNSKFAASMPLPVHRPSSRAMTAGNGQQSGIDTPLSTSASDADSSTTSPSASVAGSSLSSGSLPSRSLMSGTSRTVTDTPSLSRISLSSASSMDGSPWPETLSPRSGNFSSASPATFTSVSFAATYNLR